MKQARTIGTPAVGAMTRIHSRQDTVKEPGFLNEEPYVEISDVADAWEVTAV